MRPALLAALVLTLAAPVALAFPAAAQIKTAFVALDSSKNESIDLPEWDTASFALFRAADKNNNNSIDAPELQGSSIAQDTFLRADTDRDEFLSLVEFELLLLMEQVGWHDRNQNARIELSELGDSLRKAFALLDADSDSRLTPAEATSFTPAAFKTFDTDADGRLTVEEYIAGYRAALLG